MATATRKKYANYAVKVKKTADAKRLFDRMVKKQLNVTAEEFIERYRAGKYDNRDDCTLRRLLMMLPFTGYSATYGKKQSS